jgi:membrane-associated phospholipid phosphatase
VFFAAVLPTLFISHGIRHGRWADRNVGARRPRLIVLAFITASVTVGLILLIVLRAPVMVTGYLAFMLTSVAVLAVITTVWKISIHCAVASGSVAILALTYGPLVLPGFLLVALLGWSRVALRDHTTAQVVGGMVLGALAAVIAYAALAGTAGLSAVCALAHPSPSPLGTLYLPVRGRRFRDGQGIRGSLGRSRPGRQPRCGDTAR